MALYGSSYMLIRVIFSAIFYDSQHFGAELFTERCSACYAHKLEARNTQLRPQATLLQTA